VFFRDVVRTGAVWTVRDAGGIPALVTESGRRAMPFWSSATRVQRIIATLPAYGGFEPERAEDALQSERLRQRREPDE
jgi:NADPH-dependent 2,4-dienoyl-CoA reductase/sulfur reductase-like enzyme